MSMLREKEKASGLCGGCAFARAPARGPIYAACRSSEPWRWLQAEHTRYKALSSTLAEEVVSLKQKLKAARDAAGHAKSTATSWVPFLRH
jgi:hypothetical protein